MKISTNVVLWIITILLILTAVISCPVVLAPILTMDGHIDNTALQIVLWGFSLLLIVLGVLCAAGAAEVAWVVRLANWLYKMKLKILVSVLIIFFLSTIGLVVYTFYCNDVDLIASLNPGHTVASKTHQNQRNYGRAAALDSLAKYFRSRPAPTQVKPEQLWCQSADKSVQRAQWFLHGDVGQTLGIGSFQWQPGCKIDWRHSDPSVLFALQRQVFLFYLLTLEGEDGFKGAEFARDFMAEWRRANRYWPNFNSYAWNDDTASNRIQAQIVMMEKIRTLGADSGDVEIAFLKSLVQHAKWLTKVSNYNSRTNHGMMQDCALLSIAIAYPEFDRGQKWRRVAVQRMQDYLRRAVTPDGVFLEISPGYHCFVTRKALWFLASCRQANIDIAPDVLDRLRKMVIFCREILQPDHSLPLIADTRPTTVNIENWPWKSLPHWPELASLRQALSRTNLPPNLPTANVYLGSGYFLLRAPAPKWTRNAGMMLTLSAGPLSTAHMHPNKLSITLFANGRPLLVGPGYPDYWDGQKRLRLMSTFSQNTVSVDSQSQRPGEAQVLFFRTHPERLQPGHAPQFAAIQAQSLLYEGTRHRRSIFYGPQSGSVLIVDELSSNQTHTYRQHFRFPPDLRVECATGQIVAAESGMKESSPLLVIQTWVVKRSGITRPNSAMCEEVAAFSATGREITFVTLLHTSGLSDTSIVLNGRAIEWKGPRGTLSLRLPVSSPEAYRWTALPITATLPKTVQ